jgi:uncharacterized protein YgiB involved in biofilm formation
MEPTRMKRSRVVRLVLMGAAPVALAACAGPSVPAQVYRDADDCARTSGTSLATCRQHYQAALATSRSEAPRYANRRDCVIDFGEAKCEREPRAGYYSPLMGGFLYASGDREGATARPVYKGRSGEYATAAGLYAGVGSGAVRVHPQALLPQQGVTLNRAGFGHVSSARASRGG